MSSKPDLPVEQNVNNKISVFTAKVMGLVERVIREVSPEILFDACPALLKPRVLQNIKNVIDEAIRNGFADTLGEMLVDAGVEHKFSQLSKAEELSDRGCKAWRPPGNPDKHMRSSRVEMKHKHLKSIEFQIKMKQIVVDDLKNKLNEFIDAVSKLKKMVHHIENYRHKYIIEASEQERYLEELLVELHQENLN